MPDPSRWSPLTESSSRDPLTDLGAFAQVAFLRRSLERGHAAFHAGDGFKAIYAVRSGFFKTASMDRFGHEQVVGFSMRGDLFGLDGLGSASHTCTATALEDSEIIVLPFPLMQDLAGDNQLMQHQLHQVLSREIARDHAMMMLLGSMRAEARVASFLLNLSTRFASRGYSSTDFILRMTREEIGSYLGLKLETVSRIFSQFQKSALLAVKQKHVCILDPQGLQQMCAMSP